MATEVAGASNRDAGRRAAAYAWEGRWQEAADAYREAVAAAPDDPGLRVQLAAALARCGLAREALDQYLSVLSFPLVPAGAIRRALGLSQELGDVQAESLAWLALGKASSREEDHRQAAEHARRSLALSATSLEAVAFLASQLVALSERDTAVDELSRFLHGALAREDWDSAGVACLRILELDPGNEEAVAALADVGRRKTRAEPALAEPEFPVREEVPGPPGREVAIPEAPAEDGLGRALVRARGYLEQEKYMAALDEAQDLVLLYEEDLRPQFLLAEVYRAVGDRQACREKLRVIADTCLTRGDQQGWDEAARLLAVWDLTAGGQEAQPDNRVAPHRHGRLPRYPP